MRVAATTILLVFAAFGLLACREEDSGPPPSPQPTPTAFVPSRAQPAEQWRVSLGDYGYALVATADGRVVVSAGPRYSLDGNRGIVASFELGTGKELWRNEMECAPLQPAASEEMVVVGCTDGHVFGLDPAVGQERWRFQTTGAPSAPIIRDGLVFVGDVDPEEYGLDGLDTDTYAHGQVFVLNTLDGAEVWRTETGAPFAWLTLDSELLNVGNLFVTGYGAAVEENHELLALEPLTGAVHWRRPVGRSVGPVLVAGDLLVLQVHPGLQGVKKADGSPLWEFDLRGTPAGPAVLGNSIVLPTNVSKIVGVSVIDGALTWETDGYDCPYYTTIRGDRVIVTVLPVWIRSIQLPARSNGRSTRNTRPSRRRWRRNGLWSVPRTAP